MSHLIVFSKNDEFPPIGLEEKDKPCELWDANFKSDGEDRNRDDL